MHTTNGQGFPTLLIILPVLAMIVIGFLCIRPDGIVIHERDHAVIKHGEEADAIRKCIENHGPESTWKFRDGKKSDHYVFCTRLDDGRWGIQIAQLTKAGKWLEKTAFVVKDGRLSQLIEYVSARAIEIASGL